jgi:hypothetical protein
MNKYEITNLEKHRQELIKENNILNNLLEIERQQVKYLAKQLILSGVVKRLWVKLTIIIAYLPMLLIDYLISLTTDEKYADARKTTMTAIKRQWHL